MLQQVGTPVALLWMSAHSPREIADQPYVSHDPAFVTKSMLEAVRPHVIDIIDASASREALSYGTQRMAFAPHQAAAAAELLGPAVHEEAADALIPLVSELVQS